MAYVETILISLRRSTSVERFLEDLHNNNITPLTIARPVEWMIIPSKAEHLISHDWDLVIVLDADAKIPKSSEELIDASYNTRVALSSSSTINEGRSGSRERLNKMGSEAPQLQHLPVKPLRSLSSQRLELTPSLIAFGDSDLCPSGPVSMLNYVSYQPFPHAAESYKNYLDHNNAGPMKRIGAGLAFLGSVGSGLERGEWDEVVLARFPSFKHWCEMACDPEYQYGNYKWRLPILRDTCILLTTEVDLNWTVEGSEKVKPEDTGKMEM